MHKNKPANMFPSDKSFAEQSAYLFNRSRLYLTVVIGLIIFLAILSLILYYMFSDKGDAYTGSYATYSIVDSSVGNISHGVPKSGVYKQLMKNSLIRLIYHSIFLLPCF